MKENQSSETEALSEVLNAAEWNDISIQTLPGGKETLILICKDREGSNKLNQLLHDNIFDFRVSADKSTGNYTFLFDLVDAGMSFKLQTSMNPEKYPPLTKLNNNGIGYITTGFWTDPSGKRGPCEYNARLKRLGPLDIASSLMQAERVQFAAAQRDNSPSAVILIFRDWDHILTAEAAKAYNLLSEKTISKPKLKIAPAADGTVDLTIWDILVDLEIKINGVRYDQQELESFLHQSAEDHSFAFALGFEPTDGAQASIASTKRGDFTVITLYGYTYEPVG